MQKIVVMIALSTCLTIGHAPTSSTGDRQEMREAAGVEARDRVDRRSEVRESVIDPSCQRALKSRAQSCVSGMASYHPLFAGCHHPALAQVDGLKRDG